MDMSKLPRQSFQFVFSLLMGAMMVFLMTFVITLVNVGWTPDFMRRWWQAFLVAYVVAVPAIYFVAPLARRLTARVVEVP
jgi:Protein of unknown function (DUF2798)